MSELPPGWARAPLVTIADVQLGRQRSPRNHLGPNMRPYLRAANVTWNGLTLHDVKEMNFSPSEMTTFRLVSGDILLSEASGSASEVGKPAMWRGEINDCCFQNTLLRVRAESLEPRYLLWYFKWLALSGQFARGSRGVGIHHLGAKALREWNVPVAPLSEQRRISGAIEEQFSRLDAGVAALERVQQNLKRLRIALMQAAVLGRLQVAVQDDEATWPQPRMDTVPLKRRAGRLWGSGSVPQLTEEERTSIPEHWQWSKVSELGSNTADTVQVGPMSMRSADFVAIGTPVLNVGSVQWDWIDESKLNYLPTAIAESFSRYRIRPGDVLFTRSGTVGRAAIAEERHRDWLMTFHLLRVRVDPNTCLPEYLRMVFEAAPHVRRQARGAAIGTTRAGFNTRLLAELDVPLPPLPEQIVIIRAVQLYLSEMEGINPSTWMRKHHSLRCSILAAAFSGRLVPQDSNDEPASALLERIAAEGAISNGHKPAQIRKS